MYCRSLEKKPWDVVISGYYGYNNSGDEALLSAMVSHLRELMPDIRICVLSKNPEETRKSHGVSAINRYNYPAIRKAVKNARLFVSGGGSLLQDVTSSRSLRYYLSIINMAKKQGTPVMLYANGIGPVLKANNKKRVAKSLCDVAAITLREEASLAELRELGIENKPVVTADPALTLCGIEPDGVDKLMQNEGIPANEKLFGVSIRPWKSCGDDFYTDFAKTIDDIAKTYGLVPVFVPMQYPVDLAISKNIISTLSCKSYVIKAPHKAEELIGLAGRMEFMLAERLHSLIYASDACIPTVGLSYDRKVDAFMDYIGVGSAVSVADFRPEQVKKAVADILANREQIVAELHKKHIELSEKAKQNAELAYQIIKQTEDCYETNGN